MVVLHQGMLSHFSCNQRMGIVFLAAILLQLLVLARYAWEVRFPRSYDRRRQPYIIETLDDQPLFTRRRMIVFGIWSAIVVSVAGICMASRTETLLSMDGLFITETSCIGPFAQEYRLDRARVEIEHRTEGDLSQRRSKEDNYLAISEPGKPRTLFIELDGRQNAPELLALAPRAMQHYADHLQRP